MLGMSFLFLLWVLPAGFTAVPMLHRLLPFKLPERAIPLFYFLVVLLCMFLPCRVDLALGAAGLLSMIHLRFGESLAKTEPPDMSEVANHLALAWDYMMTHLPRLTVKVQQPLTVHDGPEDDNPEDDNPEDDNSEYQEPPHPPPDASTLRIPHL